MTNQLIRITTALAVVAVAVVAAIVSLSARLRTGALARRVSHDSPAVAVHGGRAYLGRVHGGAGRQPPEPACTTAGRVEPGRRASWPRSARTWRTASGMARSAHWSAHGPHWCWSARLSFLQGSFGRGNDSSRSRPFAESFCRDVSVGVVLVVAAALTPGCRGTGRFVQHLWCDYPVLDQSLTCWNRRNVQFVLVWTPGESSCS